MRISDWSSDVCSSDLKVIDFIIDLAKVSEREVTADALREEEEKAAAAEEPKKAAKKPAKKATKSKAKAKDAGDDAAAGGEDRKSVGWGKRVAVRVDLGGRRNFKKKKKKTT